MINYGGEEEERHAGDGLVLAKEIAALQIGAFRCAQSEDEEAAELNPDEEIGQIGMLEVDCEFEGCDSRQQKASRAAP